MGQEEEQRRNEDLRKKIEDKTEEQLKREDYFPGYTWTEPRGALFRVKLGVGPTRLGRTKKENKADGKSTLMRAGVNLFRPMRWYLQQLVWSPPGGRSPGHHKH